MVVSLITGKNIGNFNMSQKTGLLSLKKLFMAAGLPGYLLFMQYILLFFVKRRRDLELYSSIDTSALAQIIYVMVIFALSFYVLILQNPRKGLVLFSAPQLFLLLYIVICFISMYWSNNIYITGFRAFETLAYLMLISWLVYNLIDRLDFQDIIEWSILWIIWTLFWSVATNVKIIGIEYLKSPFDATRLSAPMLFFFALLLTKRKYLKYPILIFVVLAVSNKIYFGIAFGLIGFYFGDSKHKMWLFLIILSLLATLVFIDIEELLLKTIYYGRDSVGLEASSGRNKIWDMSWEAFLQKPAFGYGFVKGESDILYKNFKGAISTHSFFFSGLLGTGILGTTFLILYFWSVFKKASSRFFPAHKWRPAMISTFIMGLIVSLTAPGIGGRVFGSWIPVVLIFTLISGLQIKFANYKQHYIIKPPKNENHLDYP